MKKTSNILDLSKFRKTKSKLKSKSKFSLKPNLSSGVKVSSVKTKKKVKKGMDLRPRMPARKKIKSTRSLGYDRANFTDEIDKIWKKNKHSDVSTFYRRPLKKRKSVLFLIAFLFLIAIASIAGWYFFGNKQLTGEGVSFEIKGDENVISGNSIKLDIKYANKENVKLKNIELRLNYPKGFYYVSSEPYAETLSSNVWKLEDLKPGESGKVELLAQIIGAKDEELELEAILSYEPSNFSSIFEEKNTKKFKIKEVLMDLRVEAPESIGNNNRVSYNIFYKNISGKILDNFRLKMEYPDNFTVIETNGDAELISDNIWDIGEIIGDEEKNIIVTGFFDLEDISSSTASIILEIKSLSSEIPLIGEITDNWYEYLVLEKIISASDITTGLKISVNNEEIDKAINWGDELEYEIKYKNNSDNPLEDIAIKIVLDSEYIDWDSLEDDFNGFVDEGSKSIVWDKRVVPSLLKIDIGQEGRVYFKINIVDFNEEFIDKDDYFVNSEAFIGQRKSDDEEEIISSNIIINKINSFTEFLTLARYYDEAGKEVGSGPLPPLVGETTSYQILWEFKSITNDLSDIIVKTTLPPGVEWGHGVVADNQSIIFNNETRQVIWQINFLEKGKDSLAKFNVMVTPDIEQLGKILTLNNTIILSAKDEYTGDDIMLNNNYLTTELKGDAKADGNAKVIDLDLD